MVKLFTSPRPLGTRGERYKFKKYYWFWLAIVMGYMIFSFILNQGRFGQNRFMILFYLGMGLVSIGFLVFDYITRKKYGFIDTVTIEEPHVGLPIHPKISFIMAMVLGIALLLTITITGRVWVQYPTMSFFGLKVFDALLSGFAGVIENLFYFSFLYSTVYGIIVRKTDPIFAFLIAAAIIGIVFSASHVIRYGAEVTKMMGTVIFALFNVLMVTIFKNMFISDSLHFFNNVVGSFLEASVWVLLVI